MNTDVVVEVFKTNMIKVNLAKELTRLLHAHFPGCKFNFDLQDCDKILRAEGQYVDAEKIIEVMAKKGFSCEVIQ